MPQAGINDSRDYEDAPPETPSPQTLLRVYRSTVDALARYREDQFPPGVPVRVDCDQYHGPGIVMRSDNCRPDQLAVRLGNGNTWWYPLDACTRI